MKNRRFNIFALVLALGFTLILGGCSKNGGQPEDTGNGTAGTSNISVADTNAPQTADGGSANISANTTAPDNEAVPTEGATIPEDWHRILI